jgi:hypothetical protein
LPCRYAQARCRDRLPGRRLCIETAGSCGSLPDRVAEKFAG